MEILFCDRHIRSICEDGKTDMQMFGQELAEEFRSRIADIWAARSFDDYPLDKPVLDEGAIDKFTWRLSGGIKIEFIGLGLQEQVVEGRVIFWSKIKRIKILKIELIR